MRKIYTKFLSYVEGDHDFYSYPLHYDDVDRMPDKAKIEKELKSRSKIKISNSQNIEDYWINSIGKTLYSKVIDKYNKKMWLVDSNKKLDTFQWSPKGATIKSGPRRGFSDAISAFPIKANGYNDYFDLVAKLKTKYWSICTIMYATLF